MSSPQKVRHGYHQLKLAGLVNDYVEETPGADGCVNSTSILGPSSEPQPDTCLYILPEYGGQSAVDKDGYMTGAPEWIGEISDSTESIDLNRKKLDYEKAGVRENMVAAVRTKQVYWFIRRRGKFKPLIAGPDGIVRSEVFPGFWLDPQAFLNRDGKRIGILTMRAVSQKTLREFDALHRTQIPVISLQYPISYTQKALGGIRNGNSHR